jgi:hypothetical protein
VEKPCDWRREFASSWARCLKVILKNSPDGEETVIHDLGEVRAFMHK